MIYALAWLGFAIAVALFANKRGRGSGNWFLISAVLSPVVGFILLLVTEDLSQTAAKADLDAVQTKCPACAELVLTAARVCKHCGSTLTPDGGHAQHLLRMQKDEQEQAKKDRLIKSLLLLAVVIAIAYFSISK